MELFQAVFMMEALAAVRAPSDPSQVVAFWRDAGKTLWFAKDPEFDRHFREAFLELHEAAAREELDDWRATAEGALGLLLLLDQFPRNAFRGTRRMYATDALARKVADAAIHVGHDLAIEPELRLFMYLPFAHSENLADQERSLHLCRGLGERDVANAQRHRDIVHRFGRFPHRNAILGRTPRLEELRYLAQGGYAG
jgi:uncharacterized protein (DUF924 family)